MGARQIAFEFGPPRPAPWLDPQAEHARKHRVLERMLASLMGTPIALTITDNSRTMLSARQRDGLAHVRLHHMFIDADETTIGAVARYLTERHAPASRHLQIFIRQHGDRIRRRRVTMERRTDAVGDDQAQDTDLDARGQHHDLRAILTRLNASYDLSVPARIGWARMTRVLGRQRRRRSIKLGSYRGREPLIRVHPVLDAAWVPSFFVEYIVYHEMLHHVVPMPVRNGRRSLHGADFRARERQFERYAEAIAWERDNLDRLLSG
jgi:hypothetical protein